MFAISSSVGRGCVVFAIASSVGSGFVVFRIIFFSVRRWLFTSSDRCLGLPLRSGLVSLGCDEGTVLQDVLGSGETVARSGSVGCGEETVLQGVLGSGQTVARSGFCGL